MARWLNKAQIIELLNRLDIDCNPNEKYNVLRQRLFRALPEYQGKRKYTNLAPHVQTTFTDPISSIADDLEIFNNYQPPPQHQQHQSTVSPGALSVKDLISRNLRHGLDFAADLSTLDNKTQEDYLMGLVESLKSIQPTFGRSYLTIRFVCADGSEYMRAINPRTLSHIIHLIDVLEGRAADTSADFTDSDQAILMAFVQLKGFALEWYEYKRPSKAGGYFPYHNTIDNLDLSVFGIYHKYDNINYQDNCFIHAAVNSNLFTNQEIDFMRSIINTRYLPRDELKYFAELFDVGISVSYFNDKRNKIDKAVKFNEPNAPRHLRLLLRCGHYMLYRDELVPSNKYDIHNLNTLITKMIANKELEPITDFNNAEKFMTHTFEFEHLEFTPYSIRPINSKPYQQHTYNLIAPCIYNNHQFHIAIDNTTDTIDAYDLFHTLPDKSLIYMPDLKDIANIIPTSIFYAINPIVYRKTVQQIKLTSKTSNKIIYLRSFKALTSIDATTSTLDEFKTIIDIVRQAVHQHFSINLDDFNTLPKLSYTAAQSYGCFDNVYALSGIVQAFAKCCVHGGIVQTMYDHCFEVDNVTCLDINSSYGTSMYRMQGIPRGKPHPFYQSIPHDACYALIQCNITNIGRDELGRFTFVKQGINFIDSVLLEELKKYVTCTIDIINGYYYNEGFNNKINDFAKQLYQLRSIPQLNKFGKNMLSCLYGKCLQSSAQYKTIIVSKTQIHDYMIHNGNFIYEIIKKPTNYIVKLMHSVNLNFNLPTFGVQVLSESRKRMNDIIHYCNTNHINIYSIKTDSFTIDNEDVNKFAQKYVIGHELGNFKIEYIANRIKFTSRTCYKAELNDGSTRTRGKVL